MAADKKNNFTPVEQDLEFQRKEWWFERFGWVVMALVLVLGFLGIFGGDGPLNRRTVGERSAAVWMEYDTFLRQMAPTQLVVHASSELVSEGELRISFPQRYLEQFQVESVFPQPDQVGLAGNMVEYTFTITETAPDLNFIFNLEPEKMGTISGEVQAADQPGLSFQQFVYP